ncbi:MAG: hypothetical protein CL910_19765 [Deltaproteobacteria bacterium]|nr:hypothetical protein [Deltaproteobacteria bacterium]
MRRLVLALGFLGLLLGALAVGYVSTRMTDLPDPGDADLAVQRLPGLPLERNAYAQLVLLGQELALGIDDAAELRGSLQEGSAEAWRGHVAAGRATLDALPADPFSALPLRYSRRERQIASVGAEGAAEPLAFTIPF